MALAEAFDPERDRVVWDVGHQAYAWKILTGRGGRFGSIRTLGGLSPFLDPAESPADAAVSGHAGSALSVALGLAAARDRRGGSEHVVAVVGDASMANGHSLEALNNCAAETKKLLVVLNDNEMSISRSVGSLSRVLARRTSGVRYNRAKNAVKAAWVPIERLTTSYPGKVFQLGYAGVLTGNEKTSDLVGSWSKENFVKTKTKFLVLDVPAEDCVAFTLDYQLITKTAENKDILGPRSVYVNDGSGWTWVGDFDYSSTRPCHVEVYLDYPMDLVAVAAIPNVRDPQGFTVRQSLLDVKCR